MATAKKKINSKAAGRKKMVWHITDFRELFELPDDLRKKRIGPLSYTKSFVSLTGKSEAPEVKHCERLNDLKSRPERHLLRSVFEDLKNFSGKKELAHRGYLVTTAEQPAGYEYLASQLKIDISELKKAVPILGQIGLLERISMDGFADEARPKKTKSKARKKDKSEQSGTVRNSPDASGKRRKTLKKRKGNQSNYKTNSNENNGNDKGNTKGELKRQDKDNSNAIEAPPPTTQPIKPQVSAKRGVLIQFTPPSELKNTGRLGDIAEKILHRYNPAAKQFAFEVYEALKLPWDPTSEQGKRELGCFASIWEKAVGWQNAGIAMTMIDELRERAIAEARKIANRRQNRKKGAVFCVVFKRLLSARCKVVEAV